MQSLFYILILLVAAIIYINFITTSISNRTGASIILGGLACVVICKLIYDNWHSINVQSQLDMDQIIPNLYVGSLGAGKNGEVLRDIGVKRVINLSYVDYPRVDGITYKQINIDDSPSANIQPYFQESCRFIKDGLENDEKVLVHCYAGISRSVTIIIAYLVSEMNMTVEEALRLVRAKRPIASPNAGFMAQLKELEQNL